MARTNLALDDVAAMLQLAAEDGARPEFWERFHQDAAFRRRLIGLGNSGALLDGQRRDRPYATHGPTLQVFGVEEWSTHFHASLNGVQLQIAGRFPWLNYGIGPCPFRPSKSIAETHNVFLGLEKVSIATGRVQEPLPMDVLGITELVKTSALWQNRPRIFGGDALQFQSSEPVRFRWFLVPMTPVPYERIPDNYEIMRPAEALLVMAQHQQKWGAVPWSIAGYCLDRFGWSSVGCRENPNGVELVQDPNGLPNEKAPVWVTRKLPNAV